MIPYLHLRLTRFLPPSASGSPSRSLATSRSSYTRSNSSSNIYTPIPREGDYEKEQTILHSSNSPTLLSTSHFPGPPFRTRANLRPSTCCLLLILISLISILLVLTCSLFAFYLFFPRELSNDGVSILAWMAGEVPRTFSTRGRFCKPLLEERERDFLSEGGGRRQWEQDEMTRELPVVDWARVITGSELLSRVIQPVADTGNPTTFPRFLHQTWKTHDIPPQFLAWSTTWRSHHNGTDGWEQVIWSDEDNDKLVREEFPEWLDLYRGLETSIHKADFVRPLYMYRSVRAHLLFLTWSLLKKSKTFLVDGAVGSEAFMQIWMVSFSMFFVKSLLTDLPSQSYPSSLLPQSCPDFLPLLTRNPVVYQTKLPT